jgi:hypothetical protein
MCSSRHRSEGCLGSSLLRCFHLRRCCHPSPAVLLLVLLLVLVLVLAPVVVVVAAAAAQPLVRATMRLLPQRWTALRR